jgi:catechol 2,3-dioxygenase-like lactoylglutathione lyase family enzyme
MRAHRVIPILNVSNIQESFAWFEKLGWSKGWDWGDPVGFGGVSSGHGEIFLCQNGQGGRGKGSNTATFGSGGSESADKGCWISLMIDDVDEAYKRCVAEGLDITFPPTDMPWGLREMHVRHPDGHVFRIGHELKEDE